MWRWISLALFMVIYTIHAIPSFAYTFSPLPIDLPNADFISPQGINDAEQIVGTYRLLDDGLTPTNELRTHGFLLQGTVFTPIDVPDSTTTSISDINNAGQIVGAFGDANGDIHGFVLEGETFTTIDVPGAILTAVRGINDLGQIVGIFDDVNGDRHGFFFDGTTYSVIDFPEAVTTVTDDVNSMGKIVGTWVGGAHGFFAEDGILTPFDVPSSLRTILKGINDSGQVAGIFDDATGVRRGFVLDGDTVHTVDAPGSADTELCGINNLGQLVGSFYDGSRFLGFIATPRAAPMTLPIASVTASRENPPNVAANTIDGDLGTWWSARGDGAWIRYELEAPMVVNRVSIAWLRGDLRFATFDIEISMNRQEWTVVHRGNSSGATLALQTVHIPNLEARYVRIVGHGNSENNWNSIAEVQIEGAEPVPSEKLAIANVQASAENSANVAANTLDGLLSTRWSARGEGQWIRYELQRCDTVSLVLIAWFRGDERVASFDIETSTDGASWTRVHSGGSSGGTLILETVDIPDDEVCFVRIVGFGNTINNWNSITEVELRRTE
ncbi:discoidin domain-containing protein [Candidatus Entotheonella palauensis]|uniref:discoidin domain-containing protein n=1 Tax=Candidatus Entotheonella palauensis TaxID=93172 RepID=UPI000B7E474C|nr:discoidin domain-containing protein [Candidatus Entotheonella palauensis]